MDDTFKAKTKTGAEIDITLPYSARQMIERMWLAYNGITYDDLDPKTAKALSSEMWFRLNRADLKG